VAGDEGLGAVLEGGARVQLREVPVEAFFLNDFDDLVVISPFLDLLEVF
jgi:hypothetical protein